MPNEEVIFNSRQQQTLLLLLKSAAPLTLKKIGDELHISTRTLQREISGLEASLKKYNLTLTSRAGVGLWLEGKDEDKDRLIQQLNVGKIWNIFTPEERRIVILQHLLSVKEPTKLFFFSHRLNVTEATISYDLDKLEPWFLKNQLKLIRKPGVGVYIEGEEKDIRKSILDLLYEHYSQEQLIEIMSSNNSEKMKFELSIRNRLLYFIEPKMINEIEQAVRLSEQENGYAMTDSTYIGLVVHIALAVQRIKNGENILIDLTLLNRLKENIEFSWAARLAEKIGAQIGITMPESEVGYITTHLLGVRSRKIFQMDHLQSPVEDYVYQMIRIAQRELKINLEDDSTLVEHLSTHLESAIVRIKLHLDIRNPLLEDVKSRFPDVYSAAAKAANYLEECLGCTVPEEEIGYIAMHIGSVVLRKKEMAPQSYRVLLVCASGMGTSKLLAAQIEKELPLIRIVKTVSLLQIEEALRTLQPIDLIISTVPIDLPDCEIAIVNPFLSPHDLELIQSRLASARSEKEQVPNEETLEQGDEEHIMVIDKLGEGLTQLLDHIFVFHSVAAASKEHAIEQVPAFIPDSFFIDDPNLLVGELIQREKLGGWVVEGEGIAMLHFRSKTLSNLCVCVLKFKDEIEWSHSRGSAAVHTLLILLAPKESPKEHIELIGVISAALIEKDFIQALRGKNEESIRKQIRTIVRRGYLLKVNAVLRGKL